MAFKFVALLACVAYANAGLLAAPAAVTYSSPVVQYNAQLPTVTSQQQNILRTPGNLAQVSTYSKTIDTPFSSVSKHDVRVSNPGFATTYQAPVAAYAAPAIHATYAAPAVHATYAAPAVASYSTPVVKTVAAAPAHGLLGVAYSAAPAVAHVEYHGNYLNYAF